jgi:hypothetical protein
VALVVQWIGCLPPKEAMLVRFQPRAQNKTKPMKPHGPDRNSERAPQEEAASDPFSEELPVQPESPTIKEDRPEQRTGSHEAAEIALAEAEKAEAWEKLKSQAGQWLADVKKLIDENVKDLAKFKKYIGTADQHWDDAIVRAQYKAIEHPSAQSALNKEKGETMDQYRERLRSLRGSVPRWKKFLGISEGEAYDVILKDQRFEVLAEGVKFANEKMADIEHELKAGNDRLENLKERCGMLMERARSIQDRYNESRGQQYDNNELPFILGALIKKEFWKDYSSRGEGADEEAEDAGVDNRVHVAKMVWKQVYNAALEKVTKNLRTS